LFPQARNQVRITFYPPVKGLRGGAYPFQVIVRADKGGKEEVAQGTLDVSGTPAYQFNLVPKRKTARGRGKFRLQIKNTGTADLRLKLEAQDPEEACRFRFPEDDEPRVDVGTMADLPLEVIPHKRPFVGKERSYDFRVDIRPLDGRGQPQSQQGQYA